MKSRPPQRAESHSWPRRRRIPVWHSKAAVRRPTTAAKTKQPATKSTSKRHRHEHEHQGGQQLSKETPAAASRRGEQLRTTPPRHFVASATGRPHVLSRPHVPNSTSHQPTYLFITSYDPQTPPFAFTMGGPGIAPRANAMWLDRGEIDADGYLKEIGVEDDEIEEISGKDFDREVSKRATMGRQQGTGRR